MLRSIDWLIDWLTKLYLQCSLSIDCLIDHDCLQCFFSSKRNPHVPFIIKLHRHVPRQGFGECSIATGRPERRRELAIRTAAVILQTAQASKAMHWSRAKHFTAATQGAHVRKITAWKKDVEKILPVKIDGNPPNNAKAETKKWTESHHTTQHTRVNEMSTASNSTFAMISFLSAGSVRRARIRANYCSQWLAQKASDSVLSADFLIDVFLERKHFIDYCVPLRPFPDSHRQKHLTCGQEN